MANEEHLQELKKGVPSWNRYVEASKVEPDLSHADLRGTDLSGAILSGADLTKANLYGVDLTGARLYKANLGNAILIEADLVRAELGGADLSGAYLHGAKLRNVNLDGADLIRTKLEGAQLVGAKLRKANLDGADLSKANLYGADLYGAYLATANLEGAELSRTNLVRVNLYGANLEGAELREADLGGSEYDSATIWPTEFDPEVAGAAFGEWEEPSKTGLGEAPVSDEFGGPGFVLEFEELIDDDEAVELWRETEPLRGAVQYLLQSDNDLIPEEVRHRADGHLRRLEDELNTAGGALGGPVRSYWLSLSDFVATYTIRPALAEAGEFPLAPIADVVDRLDDVRANTRDPEMIGPVLDAIAELAAGNPDVDPAEAKESVAAAIGLGGGGLEGIGRRSIDGVVSGAVGAALAGTIGAIVSSNPIIAAVTALLSAVVVMARRSYRISRREVDSDGPSVP